MRIKSIKIENFKSLVDFEIELSKFSCLIGLNGAGKSTVLQFVDFLSQLVRGDMAGWLAERKWKSSDLKSKLTKKTNLKFEVRFGDEHNRDTGQWKATYSPNLNRCIREQIVVENHDLETKTDHKTGKESVWIKNCKTEPIEHEIVFDYTGSILSALKEELLPKPILECKQYFEKITSLELLSPNQLRQRSREAAGALGLGGRNLAALIHEMSAQNRRALFRKLKTAYPQLSSIRAKSLRSGWKQIEIGERFSETEAEISPSMVTQARHINDGMLRLIAILAELQSDDHFLLFDEVENGINPEHVEFVIDQLVNARPQILVTTHSPMILNYLTDDVATRGVVYLYKTKTGHTKSIPFFKIPSLAEKLTIMGPGEAFVDTDLTQLGDEIERVTEAK